VAAWFAVVACAAGPDLGEQTDVAVKAENTSAEIDRVYLAIRTDDKHGTGSMGDPFNASTAAQFDALFAGFWQTHGSRYEHGEYVEGKPLAIHLGRGVFETRSLSDYGPHAGGHFATQHWLAKGWRLRGAGMHETEIRNVNPNPGGVWMFSSSGGSWGGPESGGITIADLTLNPQKSQHEDRTQYRAIITSADGETSTATTDDEGWRVGMRIEITGENYNGPTGTWDGGGWKLITAVAPGNFSWHSKNTLTGAVTVRRVGEWNGTRINGPSNRAERVRVIDAGANSLAETWPLWVGGDDLIIDSCVVERCSGIMSGIGAFPGRNRTVRNCIVDGDGCDAVLAISAVEHVEENTIRNATHAIYADTFSTSDGIGVHNNIIENPRGGGILIRPHDHTRKIVVTGNRVRGGSSEIGIWIDPLSTHWNGTEWQNPKGEKIWIDDVMVVDNDVADKRIEMSQARDVTIRNNVAGFGVFYRMPTPASVSGNRTPAGEVPAGLEDRSSEIDRVAPAEGPPSP
jgi:hypothetical protein